MGDDEPRVYTAVMDLTSKVGSLEGKMEVMGEQVSDLTKRTNKGDAHGCPQSQQNRGSIRDLMVTMDKRFESTQLTNKEKFAAQQKILERHQVLLWRLILYLVAGGTVAGGTAGVMKWFGI